MLGGKLATLTPSQANSSWNGNRYCYYLPTGGGSRLITKRYRKPEYAARAFIKMYEKEFPNGRSHT